MTHTAANTRTLDHEDTMDCTEANRQRNDLFLLDVREADEWDAGHVPGSVHIPVRELGPRQAELPSDRTILAICRSGSRSGMVTRALTDAGYQVENLEGGLQVWEASGFDLESSDGESGTVI
jgi:rhodanese-related sulfurtransferase